ncbi:MAG TPA: DUF4214 domain-containing protein [Acidimicrobiales bacterium]|nr:DUF4214 domain-containing protein [Acidimicrobiales bacterium]
MAAALAASSLVAVGADAAVATPAAPAVDPATVPGPPTIGTASAGHGQVTLTWTAPASDGGSAITSYRITPMIGATAQPEVISRSAGTTKVVTGLSNGVAYTFTVAATNDIGTGPDSLASNLVIPTSPVTPYEPFTSWTAFVDRQFLDITAKPPTSAQRTSWVSQLNLGTKQKGDLVHGLRRGDENLKNVDPVVRIYRAFLGRAPDAGGLKFWINRKRVVAPKRTWNVTQIATDFTNSSEFKRKYGSLTNRQFVNRIYVDVLGRTSDPSGVDYWTKTLDTKKKTKAQVMVGFSESNEYKTKQAQNTDVTVAYVFLLGRAPTVGEAADWVARQKAGTAHTVLLNEILNSAAYSKRITG